MKALDEDPCPLPNAIPNYPLPSTDRIRVLTIQGAWPREGTASSISGWVFTKLRISSGRALEALYCIPGAAQHPGLGEDRRRGVKEGSEYLGSSLNGSPLWLHPLNSLELQDLCILI